MRYIFLLSVLFGFAACNTTEDKSLPINVPEDFEIELLFSVSDHGMGSWVSITTGNQDDLYVSDQYGKIYHLPIPEKGEVLDSAQIQPVKLEAGYAQGLLWANNSLYVMVNLYPVDSLNITSGLYRLSDTDGNGELDQSTKLFELDGAGEHGPHGIVEGPDGYLYFMAGNHTLIPEAVDYYMPPNWGEDNILPVIKDPRGHANSIKAPGGWLARTDSIGSFIEVVNVGFRNSYDIAFNSDGDAFTFDSDMEWDMGTPWYRPIRVCHLIPGADFGWRTGSGKFPEYYPDNLPGILSLNQGSPTGVLYGGDLKFPSEYRDGLFIMDWSFGTVYFIDLKQAGNTYTASASEFLSGKSLPLTDMVAANGDLLFTTGGRRLNSNLYRLSYTGEKDTGSRNRMAETYSGATPSEANYSKLDYAWEQLGSADRVERYLARTTLEEIDWEKWSDRFISEQNPDRKIQASIAASRIKPGISADEILSALAEINFSNLKEYQKTDLIRAWQLVLIRFDAVNTASELTLEYFDGMYPSDEATVNRELLKLLVAVNSPTVVGKTIDLIEKASVEGGQEYHTSETLERSDQYGNIISLINQNSPETALMAYLESLSIVRAGWNEESKSKYYAAFQDIFTSTGGWSYKGFAERILERSIDNLPEEERSKWRAVAGTTLSQLQDERLADLPKPKGPGKAWSRGEVEYITQSLNEGNIENGKVLFDAALCSSCHVVNGMGYPVGPDLSTVGSRFSIEDLITAIIDPDNSVTDQYQMKNILRKDSTVLTGRIIENRDDTVILSINPFDLTRTRKLAEADIIEVTNSNRSAMPPGLLNRLNEMEVRDLFLYLSSLQSN